MTASQSTPMGSVALVTGCSSGFGLKIAVSLARRGFRVVATLRDLARREGLDAAAQAAGVSLDVRALDVRDPARIAEVVAEYEAAGGIDLLVNNAGIGILGYIEDQSLDEIRSQIETNLLGAIAVTKAVLPGMLARSRGRIVNVSSGGGRVATPGVGAYNASKFGLEGFSEALRIETAGRGVAVVIVEPGLVHTEMFARNLFVARAVDGTATPQAERTSRMRAWLVAQSLKAGGDPQAVADVVVRAATVPKPRLRYAAGFDVRVMTTLRALLPGAIYEWIWARQLSAMAGPPLIGAGRSGQS